MHRKAIDIDETLANQEGIARHSGNLGLIYWKRGVLDRAEEMHRKSLAIEVKLNRQEGMATQYGNLGLIYWKRGELDRAEEMHRKAMDISKILGNHEGIAAIVVTLDWSTKRGENWTGQKICTGRR